MTAGTVDQKAAKVNVAKREALVLIILLNSMIGLKDFWIIKVAGALGKRFQIHKEIGLLGALAT